VIKFNSTYGDFNQKCIELSIFNINSKLNIHNNCVLNYKVPIVILCVYYYGRYIRIN